MSKSKTATSHSPSVRREPFPTTYTAVTDDYAVVLL